MPELDSATALRRGIEAVRADDYLTGLSMLTLAYGPNTATFPGADGLSHYGLCIALLEKKYKPAVDFCKKAIEMQFYNGEHYANLARVYMAGDHRKKALSAIEDGLKVLPDDEDLMALREQLGLRASPPIPFLSRSNPINVFLGRQRHAKKVAGDVKKKKAATEARRRAARPPQRKPTP